MSVKNWTAEERLKAIGSIVEVLMGSKILQMHPAFYDALQRISFFVSADEQFLELNSEGLNKSLKDLGVTPQR